ncbi:MAG: hypothetical protein ACLSB9_27205 [Hydrogeniiclostridium mannosilyticum]
MAKGVLAAAKKGIHIDENCNLPSTITKAQKMLFPASEPFFDGRKAVDRLIERIEEPEKLIPARVSISPLVEN